MIDQDIGQVNTWFSRVENGLAELWTVQRWSRWFRGGADVIEVVQTVQGWCRCYRSGADGLEVVQIVLRRCRCFRGGADDLEVAQKVQRWCRWFRGAVQMRIPLSFSTIYSFPDEIVRMTDLEYIILHGDHISRIPLYT